ncbi:PfkB family carbohydrate kinase [Pseudonocardia yuanmonensis]|uniref:PfkB family carbohydrate kinase n=1 Tax=Pseudonocardia yuanmonensis TaxID=1095914 RepID=A0ABP8WQ31_9PSEU
MRTVPEVVVVGQLARDLVLVVDEMPGPGSAADVRERHEMLGGKGANCAVGVTQLGATASLVAVAGDDTAAELVLDRARLDGLDVSRVVRRPGTATGLVVDVLDREGRWRYLQDLGEPVLLTEADVDAAATELRAARVVVLQAQQPVPALLAAARHAHIGGARILLDGVPGDDGRDALLGLVDMLRADPAEAEQLLGREIDGPAAAVDAGRRLVDDGLGVAVLGVERDEPGNVAVWAGGEVFLPLEDPGPEGPVDTTGGGDALTAGLAVTLLRDPSADPGAALAVGVAAAASTVRHPGGRPALSPDLLRTRP